MARVTVEDCVLRVPNRFELVLLASQRARAMSAGSPITIDRDNDKNPVVALREIADGTLTVDDLREDVIGAQRKVQDDEDRDSEALALMIEDDTAATDMMSEEELLRAMSGEAPVTDASADMDDEVME